MHIVDWKTHYDLIRIPFERYFSQPTSLRYHPRNQTLKYHTKYIPYEQYKYLAKDVTEF